MNSSFSPAQVRIFPLASLSSKTTTTSPDRINSPMPTLQKLKLFATQCAAVNIPTQSPTTSPLFHLRRPRRRKTLRMLLTRRPQISDSDPESIKRQPATNPLQKRSKLKDLFLSASSSPTSTVTHRGLDHDQEKRIGRGIGPVRTGLEVKPGMIRSAVQPFGYKNRLLLRKSWRPVLSTIEEV